MVILPVMVIGLIMKKGLSKTWYENGQLKVKQIINVIIMMDYLLL